MNERRKAELRRAYLNARSTVSRRMDDFTCGLSIARTISPDINESLLVMEAIEAEVRAAMRSEGVIP